MANLTYLDRFKIEDDEAFDVPDKALAGLTTDPSPRRSQRR